VDHLDFTGYAQSAVVVDLRAGTLQGGGPGGAGSASLESIEAVRGGSFDDLLIAPEASEFGGAAFSGGGGNDTLVGGASRDALWGDAGDDQLFGNGGNDQLDGGRGADQILAGAGDDLILVYDFEPAVIDRIDGGPGRDQVQFHAARASLTVNLATGTATVGTSTFMLADVEDIIGPEYASQMTGNAAGNFLAGGGGADTLHGGPGNDTLLGGGGADSFLFAEASGSANADLIPDFAPGSDRIRLDDAAFTGIGATGGFVAGDARFAAGAGFTAGRDASDRVVYDTATGNLYYDADGSGAGAAQLIATFTGNPGIAATDIVVI
jgi:Ca2+-binding RTX toxin-like protein